LMKIIKLIAITPIILIEIVFALAEIITASITGIFGVIRTWFFKDYDYRRWLKRDLEDCDVILELGCGSNSPLIQIGVSHRTDAVDIWQPYIDMHNRSGTYRHCNLGNLLNLNTDDKYDAVVICDVLEHLKKEDVDATMLFAKLEAIATKKIILFTPNGYVDNDEVDGDPFQKHLSAWEPEDFTSRGYKVVGATGLRWLFGKASRPKYHPYSVCSIIGMLSEPLVYHRPKLAWHSYAVKELS